MRTKERYIKRVVIPVLAVVLTAYLINFIIREQVADDPPEPEGVQRSTTARIERQADATPTYSDAVVQSEVAALRQAVAQLETVERDESADDSEELENLRQQARQQIDELREATEADWEQRHQEAVSAVEEYGSALRTQVEGAEAGDPASQ